MLRYAKARNAFVELYDTFYFINERTAKELITMGIDKIFASIDAATKDTYEKIRIGSNFEKVISNVKNLIQLKRIMKASFPKVHFHYIVTKENFHEISQYIELVHSIAEGEEVGIQFTRMLHRFNEIKDFFIEIPDETVQAARKKAEELGIKVSWNADVSQVKPPMTKCTEWIMPFIFVSGHVVPCCSGNEAGHRNFQKETAMGNIFEKSFKEIWSSENYKNFRGMLHKGEVPIECRNCCLYDRKKKR